jgi:hypothetical protein
VFVSTIAFLLPQSIQTSTLPALKRAPLRFKATLIGTRLVDWDGCDGTGRYLDEIISSAHRDAAIARYVTVATSATWYADIVRFLAPRTTTATLHRLLLPFAADGVRDAADSVRVDHIITAIFRDD